MTSVQGASSSNAMILSSSGRAVTAQTENQQKSLPEQSQDRLRLSDAVKGGLAGAAIVYSPPALYAASMGHVFANDFFGGFVAPFKDKTIVAVMAGAAVVGASSALVASGAESRAGGFVMGGITGAVVGSVVAGATAAVLTRSPSVIARAAVQIGPILGAGVGAVSGYMAKSDSKY